MIFHNNHKLKKEKSEGKRDKLTWQASSISSLRSLDPGFKSCFFSHLSARKSWASFSSLCVCFLSISEDNDGM